MSKVYSAGFFQVALQANRAHRHNANGCFFTSSSMLAAPDSRAVCQHLKFFAGHCVVHL